MNKSVFIVVVVVALLGLQFADCMSAKMPDQQSMDCCGSMPCDPSNQTHDCCKGMVSPQSSNLLPVAQVSLHAPVLVAEDTLPSLEVTKLTLVTQLESEAPQHSPPELYTLHSSLLI
jgi:hypothetical protein